MNRTLNILRNEPRGRLFFLAHGQSALGTGAGAVALVVLAYKREHSAWAIALVLMADFLPAMMLGPVFGAAADRWSRRGCAIAADVARALAFVGIGLVGGIGPTVALALLAGAGAGLFTPAVLAALPRLVKRENAPAATALYGGLTDLGRLAGPALAALGLMVASPEVVIVANGLTFAVSALLLCAVDFGARPVTHGGTERAGLIREARDGLAAASRMPGVAVMILASSGVILFAGMLNVAELLVARNLGAGSSGYSLLVAAFGIGIVSGSLSGARDASLSELRRRYLGGILVVGLGLVLIGVVPVFPGALAAFAITGVGNGLVLVHQRLIFQSTVPDALLGRVFAVADTAASWAFAFAFLGAGGMLALVGPRQLVLVAGGGCLAIWVWSGFAVRRATAGPGRERVSADVLAGSAESSAR